MELCLITPVNYLDYTNLLPGRFCIAPIAREIVEYGEYFQQAAASGFNVIIDNGEFEGRSMEEDAYIALATKIGATTIVAPDKIGAPAHQNLDAAIKFAEKVPPKMEVMFVPQCEPGDYLGFTDVLRQVLAIDCITVIGICRDAVYNAYGQWTQTQDQELNRFYFAAEMQRNGYVRDVLDAGKKFHFLGLGDNVFMLQYYWFVDTVDTASLFWQSVQGEPITNGVLTTQCKRPHHYFTLDLDVFDLDEELLRINCRRAQMYADKATQVRNQGIRL